MLCAGTLSTWDGRIRTTDKNVIRKPPDSGLEQFPSTCIVAHLSGHVRVKDECELIGDVGLCVSRNGQASIKLETIKFVCRQNLVWDGTGARPETNCGFEQIAMRDNGFAKHAIQLLLTNNQLF